MTRPGIINRNYCIFLNLIFLAAFSFSPLLNAGTESGVRDDGLTIAPSILNKAQLNEEIQFVRLIVKTGFSADPQGKAGLTRLTNEMIYNLLRFSVKAFAVTHYTAADFSVFDLWVSLKDETDFFEGLDQIIRMDALPFYDLSNEIIAGFKNEPRPPNTEAELELAKMLYGANHPYLSEYTPNPEKLNISEANKWFRQIYRPNNLIISSSLPVPDYFLRKPTGREFKERITFLTPKATWKATPESRFIPNHDNLCTILVGTPAPKIDEPGCLAMLLATDYLRAELTEILREESGLTYDATVSYSYISKPAAPSLTVAFQVFPKEAGNALAKTVDVFTRLAQDGIPESKLTELIMIMRHQYELRDGSLPQLVIANGYSVLFNQAWLVAAAGLPEKLKEAALQIKPLMNASLNSMKIAVAGPPETAPYLKKTTVTSKFNQ